MTRDRYLTMCEQLGTEPNEEDMPPGIEDLPEIIQVALHIYDSLGDRLVPDVGFLGKDYTNLRLYMEVHEIEDKEFFLDIISWLDSRAVKKSAEAMKREMDKLKRKSSGK